MIKKGCYVLINYTRSIYVHCMLVTARYLKILNNVVSINVNINYNRVKKKIKGICIMHERNV